MNISPFLAHTNWPCNQQSIQMKSVMHEELVILAIQKSQLEVTG